MVYEILFKDDFNTKVFGTFEKEDAVYIKDTYEVLEMKEVLIELVG